MRHIYHRKFLAYLLSLLLSLKSVSTFFFPPLGGGGGGGGCGCGCGCAPMCGPSCGGFGGGFQQPCLAQPAFAQPMGCGSGCGGGFGGLGGGLGGGCGYSGGCGGLGMLGGCSGMPFQSAPFGSNGISTQPTLQTTPALQPFVQGPAPTQVQTPVAAAQPPPPAPPDNYVNNPSPSSEPSGYEYKSTEYDHDQHETHPPPPPPPPPNPPPHPYHNHHTTPGYTPHSTSDFNSYANDNVDNPKPSDITSVETFGDKLVVPPSSTVGLPLTEDFYEDKVPEGEEADSNSTGNKKDVKNDLLSPDYSENSFKSKVSGVPSDPMAADPDATGDPKCSSETLRLIMHENIVSSPTISKQLIFSAGRLAFGQTIDVICSRNKFSYTVVSSKIFCEASRGRITCFAFLQP